MTSDLETRLAPYLFPVEERPVFFSSDPKKETLAQTSDYKALVRKDNGQLISVQRDSYKMVPNSEVIKPLMEQLHTLDTSWYVDPSHSFVTDEKMRLQVTFPELIFHDGRSDIALSLFLHNSYDSTEGVKLLWGAIRGICKNGMVFGQVLAKYSRKHTHGLEISNLREQLESTYEKIPVIQHRIQMLQTSKVTDDLRRETEALLGKKAMKHVEEEEKVKKAVTQWAFYNLLTYFVSHMVKQQHRAVYQQNISRLFAL